MGIPDAILRKPGPLDDTEWELMREHPAIGARIVSSIPILAHLAPAVHERWDGGGYPTGLGGEDIPIAARSLGHQAALDELRAGAGSQFDPAVIHALLDVLV